MSSEPQRLPPEPDGLSSSGGSVDPFRIGDIEKILAVARPILKNLADELLRGELGRRIDASDLVQETLLKGAAQCQQFQGSTDEEFFGWLNQILRNNLVDVIRHHTSQKRDIRRESVLHDSIPDQGTSPSSYLCSLEEQARVTTALEQLSDVQRQVLRLRNEGLTFEEIGQQLGRSSDATRMLWGRSILLLGKLLTTDESTRVKHRRNTD